MYIEYYQFKEKPFNLTPDPKFLYYSKHHQGALDHLLYGIKEREGFMALMGGVGTGKTTLCRALLDSLDDKVNVALVLNPMISTMDLFRTLIQELNISPARPVQRSRLFQDFDIPLEEMDPDKEEEDKVEWIQTASKKQMFDALNDYLLAQHSQGRSTVLIIDEAQTLSFEVLEQVRLLSNLETEKEKLLQIIFVGQKELNDRLLEPELKQLNQRISIRYEIFPLSLEECRNYINHRLTLASQFPRVVFTPKAIQRIHEYSQGYPRLINLACDRALLAAYNDQVDVIDRKQVKQAIRSLSGETTQLVAEEESSGWAWATAAGVVLALFAGGFYAWDKDVFSVRKIETTLASLQTAWEPSQSGPSPETTAPANPEPAALTPKPQPVSMNVPEEPPLPVKNRVEKPGSSAEDQPALPGVPEFSDYRLQVFSTHKALEAGRKVRTLKEQGYEAFATRARAAGKPWHVVYVGPFKKLKAAKSRLKTLKESGHQPILLTIAKSD